MLKQVDEVCGRYSDGGHKMKRLWCDTGLELVHLGLCGCKAVESIYDKVNVDVGVLVWHRAGKEVVAGHGRPSCLPPMHPLTTSATVTHQRHVSQRQSLLDSRLDCTFR